MAEGASQLRGWILRAAVVLAVVAFAIPLLRRSIVLGDEGYILMQSWDLLSGKLLYRDMDAFVTPGIWLVLAATFSLFEPSVIASRIPAGLALLGCYFAGYRISERLAGPRAGLATVALLAVTTVWAFPAWTFAFYSPFAVTFALLALERLLAWRDRRRGGALFACGLWVGLSILFKQNYGVFALLGLIAGLVAIRVEARQAGKDEAREGAAVRDLGLLAAGVAAAGAPVFVWIAATGALPAAWQSLVVHPFEFGTRHGIPYLSPWAMLRPALLRSFEEMFTYGAQPLYRVPPPTVWLFWIGLAERLHVLVYWAPPWIGGVLLYLGLGGRERGVDAGLLSLLAVSAGIFLGVFPRADFNHLVNVYQPVVVAGVVAAAALWRRRREPPTLLARVGWGALATVVAAYAAVALYWYVALIIHLDTEVALERAGVLARPEQAQRLHYQVRTIQSETGPDEALLTLPDLSMLNFLADRPVVSAYYNLYDHHIAHDGGATVARGSRERAGALAVTRFDDFFSDRRGLRDYAPALVAHLRTDWEMKWRVGRDDFVHLRRREAAGAGQEGESILPHCEVSPLAKVRDHLLYSALYHDPGGVPAPKPAVVESSCRLAVPSGGARLELRIDTRAPRTAAPDTTLEAEILVVDGASRSRVVRRVFEVKPEPGFPRREAFAEPTRVDLSPWAGREIELVLRTRLRGQAKVRVREARGFGTVFEDPRLIEPGLPGGGAS